MATNTVIDEPQNPTDQIPIAVRFRHKIFGTVVALAVSISVGFRDSVLGATLVDMMAYTSSTPSDIGLLYILASVAGMLSSVLLVPLHSRYNNFLLMALSLFVAAIFMGASPWSSSFVVFMTLTALVHALQCVFDSGCFIVLAAFWERRSGAAIQGLGIFYGIGAFLAPLTAIPFLNQGNATPMNISHGYQPATCVYISATATPGVVFTENISADGLNDYGSFVFPDNNTHMSNVIKGSTTTSNIVDEQNIHVATTLNIVQITEQNVGTEQYTVTKQNNVGGHNINAAIEQTTVTGQTTVTDHKLVQNTASLTTEQEQDTDSLTTEQMQNIASLTTEQVQNTASLTTEQEQDTASLTTEQEQDTASLTTEQVQDTASLTTERSQKKKDGTSVQFVYVISAAILMFLGVLEIFMFCLLGRGVHDAFFKAKKSTKSNNKTPCKKLKQYMGKRCKTKHSSLSRYRFAFYMFTAIAYLCIDSVLVGYTGYLPTFCYTELHFPTDVAAVVLTVFSISGLVSNITLALLSLFVNAVYTSLVMAVLGVVSVSICAAYVHSHWLVIWICSCGHGFSTYALYCLLQTIGHETVQADGKFQSAVMFGGQSGFIIIPSLMGFLFDNSGPMSFLYVTLAVVILLLFCTICLAFLRKKIIAVQSIPDDDNVVYSVRL